MVNKLRIIELKGSSGSMVSLLCKSVRELIIFY